MSDTKVGQLICGLFTDREGLIGIIITKKISIYGSLVFEILWGDEELTWHNPIEFCSFDLNLKSERISRLKNIGIKFD